MRPAGAPSVAATLGTPGKARRPRISGIFEGGATQPDGMQRRSNADGVALRSAYMDATSRLRNARDTVAMVTLSVRALTGDRPRKCGGSRRDVGRARQQERQSEGAPEKQGKISHERQRPDGCGAEA